MRSRLFLDINSRDENVRSVVIGTRMARHHGFCAHRARILRLLAVYVVAWLIYLTPPYSHNLVLRLEICVFKTIFSKQIRIKNGVAEIIEKDYSK